MAILLNPRFLILLTVLAALTFTHGMAYRKGKATVSAQWAAERVEQERQSQAQAQSNRDLQRSAEKRYTVQADARTKYITQTIVEIRHEAAPLAACPVPDAVRVRFNAAARCAGGDPAAACGAGESLPVAR